MVIQYQGWTFWRPAHEINEGNLGCELINKRDGLKRDQYLDLICIWFSRRGINLESLSERILDDRPNLYVCKRLVRIDCLDHHTLSRRQLMKKGCTLRGKHGRRDRQIKAKNEKRNLPQSSGRAEKAFSQNQIAFVGFARGEIIAVAALTYLRCWWEREHMMRRGRRWLAQTAGCCEGRAAGPPSLAHPHCRRPLCQCAAAPPAFSSNSAPTFVNGSPLLPARDRKTQIVCVLGHLYIGFFSPSTVINFSMEKNFLLGSLRWVLGVKMNAQSFH